MGYIKPLFSLSFWFKLNPGQLMPMFFWFFVILFGLMVIGGTLCVRIEKKEKENFILKMSAKYLKNWFFTAGIVGFLFILFNYERAILLSSRFWYLLWFIGFGIWLGFIIKKIKLLPKREAEFKKQKEFNKYLPKSKKRKK